MTRHPIVRMWDLLRKDEQLVSMMNEVRKTSSKQPLIYTFEIPETYQKTEEAPFMRLTEIMNGNALENDGGSGHQTRGSKEHNLFHGWVFASSYADFWS